MNTIGITGRLTKDPELKTTQNGVSVCSYDLAVKRPRVKDVTDFIPCVSWRQGAEYLAKYGRKGDVVAVSGALTTRAWQDKNGNKRIAYEVTAETVELVGGRKEEKQPAPVAAPNENWRVPRATSAMSATTADAVASPPAPGPIRVSSGTASA